MKLWIIKERPKQSWVAGMVIPPKGLQYIGTVNTVFISIESDFW